MLKKVQYLDYDQPCAYAPLSETGVVQTDDIVRITRIETRRTEPCVRITFRDGGHLDCLGVPEDFIDTTGE